MDVVGWRAAAGAHLSVSSFPAYCLTFICMKYLLELFILKLIYSLRMNMFRKRTTHAVHQIDEQYRQQFQNRHVIASAHYS